MCKSKNGEVISNFNKSFDRCKLKGTDFSGFRITPFSLLEFLGIVPPHFILNDIPQEVFRDKNPGTITDFILKKAKKFYSESAVLTIDYLKQKEEEQLKYVEYEAFPLFKACVSETLESKNAIDLIHGSLAFDYLFKIDFPKELEKIMMQYFSSHFFLDYPLSPLGKFRYTKKLWDGFIGKEGTRYPHAGINSEIKKSMSIKKQRDYLDCDVIHWLCYGLPYNGKRAQVAFITYEKAFQIFDRAIVHKMIGKRLFELCDKDLQGKYRDTFHHVGGYIIFSKKDGEIEEVAELNELFSNAHQINVVL